VPIAWQLVFSTEAGDMEEAIRQFSNQIFPVSGQVILFLIFLGTCYLFLRIYNSGKKDYQKMFVVKDGNSPFDIVVNGTIGCLRIIISVIIMIFFAFLAIDAILWDSAFLLEFLAQLE
jgi:hypothetical protein